jgi:Xaa-Pro aminopeptidase
VIKQKEYAKRRKQLMGMTGVGSVIIVRAAPERMRNSDTAYPYRQDSDFLYLTGFREPGAMLVLKPGSDGDQCILFCREKDAKREMWDGPMSGLEGALEDYGMDESHGFDAAVKLLPGMLEGSERIYYDLGRDTGFDQLLIGWMNDFRSKAHRKFHAPDEIIALDHILHDMRLYKSRTELTAMRKSARVAAEAHRRAMQLCRPGMNEAEIHAGLLHTFIRHQCEASYMPIVGSGSNACVLHYVANRDEMADGDLLLIDAGAEYDGYASDITRTFPVNGKFTSAQRDLYEVVLASQLRAIDMSRAGKQWDDVHEKRKTTANFTCTRQVIGWGLMYTTWGTTRWMGTPANLSLAWCTRSSQVFISVPMKKASTNDGVAWVSGSRTIS